MARSNYSKLTRPCMYNRSILSSRGPQNHILIRTIWQPTPQDQARILSFIHSIIPIRLVRQLIDIEVNVSIDSSICAVAPDYSWIADVGLRLESRGSILSVSQICKLQNGKKMLTCRCR
jgi:hypothetical protein